MIQVIFNFRLHRRAKKFGYIVMCGWKVLAHFGALYSFKYDEVDLRNWDASQHTTNEKSYACLSYFFYRDRQKDCIMDTLMHLTTITWSIFLRHYTASNFLKLICVIWMNYQLISILKKCDTIYLSFATVKLDTLEFVWYVCAF